MTSKPESSSLREANAAALRTATALARPTSHRAHVQHARAALGDLGADDEEVVLRLAGRCEQWWLDFSHHAPAFGSAPVITQGRLHLDELVARCFDRSGDATTADAVRSRSAQRVDAFNAGGTAEVLFGGWMDGAAYVCRSVAQALWRQAPRGPDTAVHRAPAVIRRVAEDVMVAGMANIRRRGASNDERVVSATGVVIAVLPRQLLAVNYLERHEVGMNCFASADAHRLMRFLVVRVTKQWSDGVGEHRIVVVEGGLAQLAELIGSKPDRLRELLDFGVKVQWQGSSLAGSGLWTYIEIPAAPSRRAELRITVGELLAPGFATRLKASGDRSHQGVQDRQLVPLPRHDPPLDGIRPNEYCAAFCFQVAVFLHFVKHAVAYKRTGRLEIDDRTWRQLADEAGLPAPVLRRVIDLFCTGTTSAPKILERHPDGTFRLSDAYAAESAAILASAELRMTARTRGQRSAARRLRTSVPRSRRGSPV